MFKAKLHLILVISIFSLLSINNVSASNCDAKYEKMSCGQDSAHSFIYEALKKGIDNDNYKCLMNDKDMLGEPYKVNESLDNRYCGIYCKEDLDIFYQGLGIHPHLEYELFSGTYFKFKPYNSDGIVYDNLPSVFQSKTCLYVIKVDLFVNDMYGINDNCNCNNIDKVNSTPAQGGFYKEAENNLNAYYNAKATVISNQASLRSIFSNQNMFESNPDFDKINSLALSIVSAVETMSKSSFNYAEAVKKMHKAINQVNVCNNYRNTYIVGQDTPDIENFYYDEQLNSDTPVVINKQSINQSFGSGVDPDGEKDYCLVTNNKLDCSKKDVKVTPIPIFIDEIVDNSESSNISKSTHYIKTAPINFYTYAKNEAKYEQEFIIKLDFNSQKSNGDIFFKDDPGYKGKISNNQYDDLGLVLPISILTRGGKYDYKYSFSRLGKNNNMLRKYEQVHSTKTYTCHYYVNNEIFCDNKEKCLKSNEEICGIDQECIPTVKKITTPKFMPLAREINLSDINPNLRELGRNWTDEKGIKALEHINELQKEAYLVEPMYTFTINGDIIKEIKQYNKDSPYSDFTLKCSSDGKHCLSGFITKYSSMELTNKSRENWIEYNEEKKIYERTK